MGHPPTITLADHHIIAPHVLLLNREFHQSRNMNGSHDSKKKLMPLMLVNEIIIGIHAQISGLENEFSLVMHKQSRHGNVRSLLRAHCSV
jgi:hypothetical protein